MWPAGSPKLEGVPVPSEPPQFLSVQLGPCTPGCLRLLLASVAIYPGVQRRAVGGMGAGQEPGLVAQCPHQAAMSLPGTPRRPGDPERGFLRAPIDGPQCLWDSQSPS